MQFPDDENGDVLRMLHDQGVDLVSPRVIDFEHVFSEEAKARAFFDLIHKMGIDAEVIEPDDEHPHWDVCCRKRMLPTHAAISETEQELDSVARRFGGHADGWGTMSNPDGSPSE